jgi:Circularly permutated YpsA SLOG family
LRLLRNWSRFHHNFVPTHLFGKVPECRQTNSDGTVIFSIGEHLSGGSRKTLEFAIKHRKPHLHVSAIAPKDHAAQELKGWIEQNTIRVLNVAGPRASKEPGVAAFVLSVLDEALR